MSQADPPFAVPPDIVLDLPPPLSVNRTRKIDWKAYPKVKEWIRQADFMFLTQKRSIPPVITGRYEIILTLSDNVLIDIDNTPKLVIDTVRRFRLVPDDNPNYLRKLTIELGNVAGCRVTIRPIA